MKIPVGMLITVETARNESEIGRLMYAEELRADKEFNNENLDEDDSDENNENEGEEESDNENLEYTVLGLDISAPSHCYLAAFILEDRSVNTPSFRLNQYDPVDSNLQQTESHQFE